MMCREPEPGRRFGAGGRTSQVTRLACTMPITASKTMRRRIAAMGAIVPRRFPGEPGAGSTWPSPCVEAVQGSCRSPGRPRRHPLAPDAQRAGNPATLTAPTWAANAPGASTLFGNLQGIGGTIVRRSGQYPVDDVADEPPLPDVVSGPEQVAPHQMRKSIGPRAELSRDFHPAIVAPSAAGSVRIAHRNASDRPSSVLKEQR